MNPERAATLRRHDLQIGRDMASLDLKRGIAHAPSPRCRTAWADGYRARLAEERAAPTAEARDLLWNKLSHLLAETERGLEVEHGEHARDYPYQAGFRGAQLSTLRRELVDMLAALEPEEGG